MNAVRKTIVESLVLGGLGVMVAFTANAVRGSGSIKLPEPYFDPGDEAMRLRGITPLSDRPGETAPDSPDDTERANQSMSAERGRLDHRYQQITFEEVVDVFDDATTATGLNVFIDARNDEHFKEGHIPGAIQCDPYNVDRYIGDALDHIMGAEKVIVYCNGGNCEDSVFTCRELIEAEVPYEAIYLYPGGWAEWTKNNMPIAESRD